MPDDDPGSRWIVGGVFEDVPENSHLRYDVLLSLEGWAEWSRTNWVGNDRYLGYVRLAPGATPESLDPAIQRMTDKHIDKEELQKAGMTLRFSMKPLREMHAGRERYPEHAHDAGYSGLCPAVHRYDELHPDLALFSRRQIQGNSLA